MVRAVPGSGLKIPVWQLGSSLHSAQLAAELGLPFAFASHFAPDQMHQALAIYRQNFRASEALKEPYVMPCINVFAAETDEEARRLFTSLQQAFINLRTGRPGRLPRPFDPSESRWPEVVKSGIEHVLRYSAVGSPETVRRWLESFIEETRPDEIMVTTQIFDRTSRLRSFEIVAEVIGSVAETV
jgi:luciferase family oxidoreductase group 1